MRSATCILCVLVIFAGCASPVSTTVNEKQTIETPSPPEHPTTPSSANYDVDIERIEKLVHQTMNERREQNGIEPLVRNETLDAVARYKSWDMAQRDYFAHEGPNGTLHDDLRDRYGTKCMYTGQNIYYDKSAMYSNDPQSVLGTTKKIADNTVNNLLNSSGHRQNALSPDYDSQGVGVFVDKNGSVYVTQELCG